MKRFIAFLISLLLSPIAFASYGSEVCHKQGYVCYKVKPQDSWERLFPQDEQRDIVQRLNRLNIPLEAGTTIAIPKGLSELSIYDVSPFPRYRKPIGEKIIYVDQKELAWGAYDATGELVWWGPIASGQDWCDDIDESCTTPPGDYRVFRKAGLDCISSIFPKRIYGPDGGAPMPYCMHFNGGYSLHGSEVVPGYRASHGCVRMFYEDAKWLNEHFVEISGKGHKGTRVIIGEL